MRDRGVAIDVVSATPKEQIAWLKRIELERIFVAAQNGIEISSFAHPDVLLARIARNIFEPVFGQRFRCLRGAGVGVAKIFLIFVPNESSAAFAAWKVPNEIAAIRSPRNIGWETAKIVGRFCETASAPASDTDALQFAFWFLIG